MPTSPIRDGFTTVYSRHTGRPHQVPNHYLDNPHLMRPFRRTRTADTPVEESETPSTDWSIAKLRDHANAHHVDLTGAGRNKSAIVERITAAARTVDPTVETTVTAASNDAAPEVSSGDVSDDETPVEGE